MTDHERTEIQQLSDILWKILCAEDIQETRGPVQQGYDLICRLLYPPVLTEFDCLPSSL